MGGAHWVHSAQHWGGNLFVCLLQLVRISLTSGIHMYELCQSRDARDKSPGGGGWEGILTG